MDAPAYTPSDAAHFLSLPLTTLRDWVFGGTYSTKHGRKRFEPIIEVADNENRMLSFRNLVELHVLSAVRRQHGVSLKAIRSAVGFLRDRMEVEHPLANVQMQTDGISLFVEHFSRLIDASRDGQVVLRSVLARYLTRIQRDDHGVPIRLFPITRADDAKAPTSIAIDPQYQFGRPFLAGSGVRTAAVAERFHAGEEIETIAKDYGCSVSDVAEAIRYELHQARAA